ncbi:MAG: hypothetical protein GY851_08955 [bacterium]|nr:hypothetical protein [bacterium]
MRERSKWLGRGLRLNVYLWTVTELDRRSTDMAFPTGLLSRKFRHLGYRQEVAPVAERAMADFVLGLSVNSTQVVLGVYDIAANGFYKCSVSEFLKQVPKNLSFPLDFTPVLTPYVSDHFDHLVKSASTEQIVGAFVGYYIARLPALMLRGRFKDWPKRVGPSEEDVIRTAVRCTGLLEEHFPAAAERLVREGPEDHRSIYCRLAAGKRMARRHELEDERMLEFLYYCDADIWNAVSLLPGMRESSNVTSFVTETVTRDFRRYWDSFRLDYMDTLRHWSYANAFEGTKILMPRGDFWEDLEARLDQRHPVLGFHASV